MPKKIIIKTKSIEIYAELNDTKTAETIYEKLPIESKVKTWGEEIYFEIPVEMGLEDGVKVVNIGDIGYWPDGNSFCIFFGKTPISTEKEIKPASEVTIIGKITGDIELLKKVKSGENIQILKKK